MNRAGQEPLVSIIVPVYNTDPAALQRCRESLVGQTYHRLEIIFIDDGSAPETAQALDAFAQPGTVIVHQPNSGVSSARNHGLAASKGEIITYVDSDDLLAPQAVQQAVDAFASGPYDVVMGFTHYVEPHDKTLDSSFEYTQQLISVTPGDMLSYHLQGNLGGPWLKSKADNVKVGVLAHFMLRAVALRCPFPQGVSMSEDTAWCVHLFSRCENPVIVDSCWYYYLQNQASLTHVFRPACIEDALRAICAIGENLQENDAFAPHAYDFLLRVYGESNRAARCLAGNAPEGLLAARKNVASIMKDPRVRAYVGKAQAAKKSSSATLLLKGFLCATGLNVLALRLFKNR